MRSLLVLSLYWVGSPPFVISTSPITTKRPSFDLSASFAFNDLGRSVSDSVEASIGSTASTFQPSTVTEMHDTRVAGVSAPRATPALMTPPNAGSDASTCSSARDLSPVPLFLWTEVPTQQLGDSRSAWSAFYRRMLHYVLGNCIRAETTRVILRVMNPAFPSTNPMWADPRTSPMYTDFISGLPPGIDLQLYPYLGGSRGPAAWAAYSETNSDPLEGVFNFAILWNSELASLNTTSRFTGIVLDLEEDFVLDWEHVGALKQVYNSQIPFLGVSIGFDEVVKLKQLAPYVDHFYMQMYDFYTRDIRRITSQYETSPFVIYRDNPAAIAQWLKVEVLTYPDLFAIYRKHRSKIYIMWSTQNRGSSDCIYPLRGTCGSHYEFGLFKPESFNEFMRLITADSPFRLFPGVQGHGLFQFDLLRTDWVPA
jgi:hypothetical protein